MMASSRPSKTSPNGQRTAAARGGARDINRIAPDATRPAPSGFRGPVKWLLDLFSSIWLGVSLLAVLFIYSSIGSAGILYPTRNGWAHEQFRQWRGLEMTEFEWFHWWPFDLLIALICINLVTATLRRIPFGTLRLGVWMIHTGIIILCIGSVIYFGTKVEGDAPVARRMITLQLPDAEPVKFIASPGQSAMVGRGSAAYFVTVSRIDPQWEILSGANAGDRAYSVFLDVVGPQQQFTRQLLAGYPQHTEDIIRTDDPTQPMQRAKKINPDGDPLIDKTFNAQLTFAPQDYMYLNVDLSKDWAIYLREAGQTEWVQRPLRGVPKYNEYITSLDAVFPSSDFTPPIDPLDVPAPAVEAGDPLPETILRVRQYLPFAAMETRRGPGGTQLDPIARIRVVDSETGREERYELLAFDPQQRSAEGGALTFLWADSIEQRDAMRTVRDPILHIHIPGSSIELHVPVVPAADPDAELFTPIEGTDYSYRIRRYEDGLPLPGGRDVAVAIVEFHSGERTFERWVFDQPSLNRDLTISTNEDLPTDEAIETYVERGTRPAPITLIGGPEHDDLHLLLNLPDGTQRFTPLAPGEPAALQDEISLIVDQYEAHTITVTRPRILPMNQRERDLRNVLAMINVEIRVPPLISIEVPEKNIEFVVPFDPSDSGEFRPIGESEYSYRIREYRAGIETRDRLDVTVVEISFGDRVFRRMVYENGALNRDLSIELDSEIERDDRILMRIQRRAGNFESIWLPFHLYPFQDAQHALRRFPYRPERIALPDGRVIEIMFSRQRVKLPSPVVLDDFEMTTHEGGFTGSTLSVLNWTSMVRFADDGGALGEAKPVSVNNPVEHDGYWFFQAQWDPPQPPTQAGDVPSLGLNYTVLGVGNRNGVLIQLLGCCIAVTGMIYTFYIKPIIRRRRETAARALAAEQKITRGNASRTRANPIPSPAS